MPYFAQASIDENGKIAGGQAGNQSGKELNTRAVYSSASNPWFSVVAKDPRVLAEINRLAKAAVANPYIGYDQDQRNTLLIQARKVGWDLSKIVISCETDCSAWDGTLAICATYRILGQVAGDAVYNVLYEGGNLPATGNFRAKFGKLGEYFEIRENMSTMPGAFNCRSGHAVTTVDAMVTPGKLSGGMSSGSSIASSKYPCKGWTGEEVRRIQRALEAKGYSVGNSGIDGDFGVDTYAAVCKFQSDRGLEIDGIVGPMTQTALYNTNAPVTPSVTYHTGTYSTAVGNLNVRTGAGTGYRRKTKAELTADGRKHSNDKGQLNSGTKVTVSKIQRDSGGNTWGLIPSGWICLEWAGKAYVK